MLLLSLIGEQPIPNLLPIRALSPDENLLVYTSRTQQVARRLRRIISAAEGLDGDLKAPPYDMPRTLRLLQERLAGQREVVFNLTGGTKLMALAAFALAAQTRRPFVYLQSEGQRSQLFRYAFRDGLPLMEERQELPTLINASEYLSAHLDVYRTDGFSRDEHGELSEGGWFEQAVFVALQPRIDEVLAGVRPTGAGQQIEIDLVLRCGNQTGIAEVKLGGGDSGKRGLDQLKMAGEPTYLGTYTAQFLIVARKQLSGSIQALASARGIHVICLPDYQPGRPLSRQEADKLAAQVRRVLCA
jgi:hypothetical protein